MIEFGSVGFLAGALAIAVPIILHLLKRKPKEIQFFPAFKFLHATVASKQNKNNIFKWLVLLMRCLILFLLALAFAWPYFPRFAQEPESVSVLLWDQSFSMQALPYREELHSKALEVIGSANTQKPMSIGMVSDEVEWNGEFTGDAAQLKTWFQNHPAGQGTSQFEQAIRQADARLKNMRGKTKRIILVTDLQTLPWQDVRLANKLSPGIQLEVIAPKVPGFQNTAITQAKITAPLTSAQQSLSLEVKIRNFRNINAVTELVTTLNGEEVDRQKLTLFADAETLAVVPLTISALEPQIGKVHLVEKDDVEPDDQAWFSINPTPPPKIYLSPMPASQVDFLKVAFAPSLELQRVSLEDLKTQTTSDQMQEAGLIIIRDVLSTDSMEKLDEALQRGARIAIIWKNSQPMRTWLDKYAVRAAIASNSGTHRFGNIDFEHPSFRTFLKVKAGSLFDILFFDPPSIMFPANARVLANFDNGKPAIAEMKVGHGILFLFASEISRTATDWPTHASFLPFWRELFLYGLNQFEKTSSFITSSKPLKFGKIQEVKNLADGQVVPLIHSSWIPQQAGNFLVKTDAATETVSVNVPPEESNPSILNESFQWKLLASTEKATNETTTVAALPPNQGKQYWWDILVLVSLLVLGEVLLANRTAL